MSSVTVTDAKDIWWALGALGALLGTVFRLGWKTKAQAQRICTLEKAVGQLQDDTSQIVMAQFATLEGLGQLGCNGNVSDAYVKLQTHIAEKRNKTYPCG